MSYEHTKLAVCYHYRLKLAVVHRMTILNRRPLFDDRRVLQHNQNYISDLYAECYGLCYQC